jgi:putative endonuclease
VDLYDYSRKDTGALGERVAEAYLKRCDFLILERNWGQKTGELDIVARYGNVLHVIEVKTLICEEFSDASTHNPSDNLHAYKIHKVARTAEWYVASMAWEGEWQVDGVLVWLRKRDGMAKIQYLPQINT